MTTPDISARILPASALSSNGVDVRLDEIDGRLVTASDLLGSLGRDWPDAAIEDACDHLMAAMRAAESIGLHHVSNIAFEIEDLLHTLAESRHVTNPEIIDAVLRGIDVMLCVTRDAGRQQAGRPAAVLDEAVEQAFARVARIAHITSGTRTPATVTLRPLLTTIREMARELCIEADKQVEVRVTGTDVVVPAAVADAVADPLARVIRNSIELAIEPAAERVRAQKSRVGSIDVAASLDRGCLVLEVRDDGAGVDLGTIRQRAEARGLVHGDAPLEPEVALALILDPDAAIHGSRDSLRERINALDGFIDVYGDSGGTRTVIRVPLPHEPDNSFAWRQR